MSWSTTYFPLKCLKCKWCFRAQWPKGCCGVHDTWMTRKHLIDICKDARHMSTVEYYWMHARVTLLRYTKGHFVYAGFVWVCLCSNAKERLFFSMSANTLCVIHVTFTSRLIKSRCHPTGCGQRCSRQTGPGAEGRITPGWNQLPQEAAWWGKLPLFVSEADSSLKKTLCVHCLTR